MVANYEGLYDVNYKVLLGKPYIFLFIRNKDGTKTKKVITNFQPYIYINPEDIDIVNSNNFLRQKVAEVSNTSYKTIYGKDVMKIILNTPSDAYHIKKTLSETYESDILFSLRYGIDEIEEVKPTKYKILYFDIETDTEQGFPNNDNPINPITSISALDNYSEKNITFVWRTDQTERIDGDMFYYDNEESMLKGFLDYWEKQDCDIITSWNMEFDMGYLISRLMKLNLKLDKLGEVKVREDKTINIFGKVLFDLLIGYKRLHMGDLKSYSLNNVSQDELGEKKEKVHNTGVVWREDLEKLISYNKKDVDLIYKIDNKCKIINIFDDIRIFAGVRNILDCFSASRIHETKLMKKFRNVVFPNKPPFREKSEETAIQGVYLKEPNPGLYSNVICIDARSMYPSVIYTFNLSSEMIDESGVQLNGIKVKQSPKGIMAQMIKELLQLKSDLKNKMVGDNQSSADRMFAIKSFINSFYGVNALTSFRLYNKEIAENIILLGREITQKCSEIIETKYGYKVIYNDTDSIFVKIPDNINAVEAGKEIEAYINNEINQYCKNKYHVSDSIINMGFEKVYDKILLQKKRRYVRRIVWKDDKYKDEIHVAGMASRRSDTPEISKKMQNELFDMILKGKNKDEVIDYLNKFIINIKSGVISKEDISQPVKLNTNITEYKSQNLPKLRGVKWSNKNLNTAFKSGTKFKMIYVKHPDTDVVCFEEDSQIEGIEIDWDKQLDKCIFQKIKPIFEALGWNNIFDELKNKYHLKSTGQTSLSMWGINKSNMELII